MSISERFQLGKYGSVSGHAVLDVSDSDRIKMLEKNIVVLFKMLENIAAMENSNKKDIKNEIPIGTSFIGRTNGEIYVLTVYNDGFRVGNRSFQSLSAAAEAVSNCRRSGWTFWKLVDGRTAKEVFKR